MKAVLTFLKLQQPVTTHSIQTETQVEHCNWSTLYHCTPQYVWCHFALHVVNGYHCKHCGWSDFSNFPAKLYHKQNLYLIWHHREIT